MAKHSKDYYWTNEQRAWANNYLKELNKALSDYEQKKKELLVARKEYISKTLLGLKVFRKYEQDIQTSIVNSINDGFSRKFDKLDDGFFEPHLEIEP